MIRANLLEMNPEPLSWKRILAWRERRLKTKTKEVKEELQEKAKGKETEAIEQKELQRTINKTKATSIQDTVFNSSS